MHHSVRLLLLFVFFSISISFPQNPGDVIWTKYYGGIGYDEAYKAVHAHDSGYVFVGSTNSYGLGKQGNAFIGKTTPTGDSIWTFNVGGPGKDVLDNVIQTSDGNYLAVGLSDSPTDFEQVYLVKFNDFGDTIWTKTYGGPGKDIAYGVVETDDNGFMIAALTNSIGAGGEDIWILRTNSAGDTLWTKTYGNSDQDAAYAICKNSDGTFGLTGVMDMKKLMVMRITNSGDTLWTRTFDGDVFQEGTAICEAPNGDLMALGHTSSYGAGELDIWLIRLSKDGEVVFTKTYGTSSYEEGRDIKPLGNKFIIAGNTNSDGITMDTYYILAVDSAGNVEWSKLIGTPENDERCYGLLINGDGNFIIAGSNSTGGLQDAALTLVRSGIETGINEPLSNDINYKLLEAYPNPFNPSTKITYTIPQGGFVNIKVYNILGKEVAELVNDYVASGTHTLTFNTSGYNLSSGIYFYTIKAGNFVSTKKLVLMK